MKLETGAYVRVEADKFCCPVCGADIEWRCWPNEGLAKCTKSLEATRSWDISSKPAFCGWTGKTKRAKCGKVMILYRLGRFNDKRNT